MPEIRAVWTEFFNHVPSGARVLDIGTGNGAIALIARQTAESLGRTCEIHGVDLGRINPSRDVPRGAELFAGITFHPGIPAEELPFDGASFTAVTGQYSLEYTDMPRTLAQVFRVLRPGGHAQFVMHHAQSEVVARAQASVRESDLVLNETKTYRKLKRFLEVENAASPWASRAGRELSSAIALLEQTYRSNPDSRVYDVTLDAVRKLLGLRQGFAPSVITREIDSVENALRQCVRRHKDLIAAGVTESGMTRCVQLAITQGFVDVSHETVRTAREALLAWRLRMHKGS